ncbi:restriction endonuclease subunit S [Mycoplasmopsis agassizii]|uniref:Restriction endonuclease subunit S n=1 Tax=Mycoplasmopsis agassizii TaxID=33922 RepID=A0ABX4H435_9BACT|nr:restriction endonuclease subunit S [Mycoplasmopsis agassizii]PAF54650.1 restriction endonuclease subunit S [Mycoplasmopsis agassizii]SMC16177.1 type I restriction enzyme, S subunit [Mycoplasmopsis agassizii]
MNKQIHKIVSGRLKDVAGIFVGKNITIEKIKSEKNKYKVMGGGSKPSGYYYDYNFENGIVLAKTGSAGNLNFLSERFWATSNSFVILTKLDRLLNKYLFYYLKSIEDNIISSATTTAIPTITKKKVDNISVSFPTLETQNKIVEKLDRIINNTDKLIKNQQEQIEKFIEYKKALISETISFGINGSKSLKDSGIKWIGQMPSNWRVIRIKDFATLKGRIGWQGLTTSDYTDEGPYLVTGTDFVDGIVNWETCAHISEERFREAPEIHLRENDLLITKDGTIGKVAIAKKFVGSASLNGGILLVRIKNGFNFDKKYIYFVLQSHSFWNWYNSSQIGGSTIKHLYQKQFEYYSFAYPSFEEQVKIAEFLDEKVSKINKLVELKKQKIELLKKYKKVVIHEYVAGKKPV